MANLSCRFLAEPMFFRPVAEKIITCFYTLALLPSTSAQALSKPCVPAVPPFPFCLLRIPQRLPGLTKPHVCIWHNVLPPKTSMTVNFGGPFASSLAARSRSHHDRLRQAIFPTNICLFTIQIRLDWEWVRWKEEIPLYCREGSTVTTIASQFKEVSSRF